jgi:hypothetical protein
MLEITDRPNAASWHRRRTGGNDRTGRARTADDRRFDRTIVRLDRSTDRERPCCENLATLRPGKGPHGAELRCVGCGRHRGWLPKQATEFLVIANRSGNPAQPIVLRDNSIGDHEMKKFDDKNRGTLFRNDRKNGDKSPNYNGSLNVGGVEHWISGWIRQSKTGEKFMSLSVKPKEEVGAAHTRSEQK